eukprot:365244-Chlamydomonas_euryale.AAC.6
MKTPTLGMSHNHTSAFVGNGQRMYAKPLCVHSATVCVTHQLMLCNVTNRLPCALALHNVASTDARECAVLLHWQVASNGAAAVPKAQRPIHVDIVINQDVLCSTEGKNGQRTSNGRANQRLPQAVGLPVRRLRAP